MASRVRNLRSKFTPAQQHDTATATIARAAGREGEMEKKKWEMEKKQEQVAAGIILSK